MLCSYSSLDIYIWMIFKIHTLCLDVWTAIGGVQGALTSTVNSTMNTISYTKQEDYDLHA